MKKLVMFAAVAVMSVVASATSVKWGVATDKPLADISSGAAYLVYGTLPTKWEAESFSKSTLTTAGLQVLAEGAIDSGVYWNGTGDSLTPTSTGLDKGNKTVYMIAISSDGKTLDVSGGKTLNLQASALSTSLSWNGASDFTKYAATVPEPTSALLMVLGVAGLALKRKRA